jgi:hypothetical protein
MGLKTWLYSLKKKLHLHLWTGWGVVESVYRPKGKGQYVINRYCMLCAAEQKRTIKMKDFKYGRSSGR